MEFKFPTNQAEMDALRKGLVQELSDDDLGAVAGGNDDAKGKNKNNGINWVCPACGGTFVLYSAQDGPKHIVKCPKNPYK